MTVRVPLFYAAAILLLFLAARPVQAAAPPPPLPPLPLWSDNRTTITVCTSSYTPMVYCEPDTGKLVLTLANFTAFITQVDFPKPV